MISGGIFKQLPAAGARRTMSTAAAARAGSSTCAAVRYGTAGEVMHALNQLSLSRDDPRLRPVKDCINRAVAVTFNGHATVQHQGSTRKGTGLIGSSDWDFFVRLDDSIPTVTHNQRMAVVEQLRQQLRTAGIDYSLRCGENRVFMWNGSNDLGSLPDVDLVFGRFKQDERLPPDNRALAHNQVAQQVVKYIKRLPERFTNLTYPKSSLLEEFVLQVQKQQFVNRDLVGEEGFNQLLAAVLNGVAQAGTGGVAVTVQAMVDAKLNTREWQAAASFVLQKRQAGFGWLIV